MKKLYIVLLMCFTINSYAQPTFTLANFPPVGTQITTMPVDPTGLSEGSAGANQTWDFSTAVSSGSPVTATMITPAGSIWSSMFPAATIAVQTTGSLGNDAYAYYNNNVNSINLIGAGSHTPTVDAVFSYTDPITQCMFPFTYNSTNTDDFVAYMTYTIAGSTVENYRHGSFEVVGDGYGTLITPTGTYTNCLRIKCKNVTMDSILVGGFPYSQTYDNNNYFSWSDQAAFQSLFQLGVDSMDDGTMINVTPMAMYSTISTGINETKSLRPLEVYPNPALAVTRINLSADELDAGKTTFLAIDMQGRIAKQLDFVIYPAAHKSVSIDMSDCTAGIYFVRLVQSNKTFSTKFVMQ